MEHITTWEHSQSQCNYPGVSSLAHSDFTHHLVHWFLEPNLHHKMMVHHRANSRSSHLVSTFTLSPDCHRHRQVSALCTLSWLWYWACSHNGVLWAGNQVECLHWAGHCITLGHCPPDQNLIPVHCVHCLPVHCVQSRRLPWARLFWQVSGIIIVPNRVSSHYFNAFHFGFQLNFFDKI